MQTRSKRSTRDVTMKMDVTMAVGKIQAGRRKGDVRVRANARDPQERWRKATDDAKRKAKEFARQNELDRKAERLKRKAKLKYMELEEEARRVGGRIDRKYQMSRKFDKWNEKFWENARDVDQKYRIRQRVKDTADDAKRKWPYIRRKLDDFAETSVGKVVIFAAFFMFLSSGLLFPLLNLLFIFWWVAPLVAVPFLNYMAKKMEEETAANQQDTFTNNPFGRSPFATKKGRQDFSSGGPVIDVDHETVDD